MDGLCRCLGCPAMLDVSGTLRLVKPMTLRVYGICESWALARRGNPIDRVMDALGEVSLDRQVASDLWWRAYEDVKKDRSWRCLDAKELQSWMDGSEGLYVTAWLLMGEATPEFATAQSARDYFFSQGSKFSESYSRARAVASGSDILSCADWPDVQPGKGRDGKNTPWKKTLRWFASEYGWGPEQVGDLTLWQFKMYTCEEESLGGSKKIGRDEIGDYVKGGPRPPAQGRHARPPETPPQQHGVPRRAAKRIEREFFGGQRGGA